MSGTERLYEGLEESPCERVDARAFLKARLIDFLIGDSDRHRGQWRWAQFPAGDCFTWLPVPEDRDKAFIDLDGQLMKLVRRIEPKFVRFQEQYPSYKGLSRTGWELDRRLLSELEWSEWDETVVDTGAVRTAGPGDRRRRSAAAGTVLCAGGWTSSPRTLKIRRDTTRRVRGAVLRIHQQEQFEIRATDEDEYLELEHRVDGALEIRISQAGTPERTLLQTYPISRTRPGRCRIYLHGGRRSDQLSSESVPGIKIRVDGGGGDDAYANNSRAGRRMTRFYDARGQNRFEDDRAHINQQRYRQPKKRERDFAGRIQT